MSTTYTIRDVTNDLTSIMTLTNTFTVDRDGYWEFDGNRFEYNVDKDEAGREIVLFQDPLPKGNHYIFNPFSEGYGKSSPATQLYYRTIRVALNVNLRAAALFLVRSILEVKEAAKDNKEYAISHALIKMSSTSVDPKTTVYDAVDDKTEGEFKKIFDITEDNLITVPYLNQQMSSKARIEALIDPQWDDKIGKAVRKKSIAVFKAAIMGILGIETPADLEQFTVKYDPDLKSAARFHTTLSTYLKIYSRFNEILPPAQQIDLGSLASTIERLPFAYAIAKHMVQPVPPRTAPTDPSSADTSRLRIAGVGGTDGARKSRFGGPRIVDQGFGGSRGIGMTPSLQLGNSGSRFKPNIISDAPLDPFAPVVGGQATAGFGGFQGGGSSFSGGGTSFGGGFNPGGGFGGGGLNLSPPNNFGDPGLNRTGFRF
jgi:hypothetical protein